MNIITKLEPCGNRIKIYIDQEFAFILYKGEVRKFHLEENTEISKETYDDIMEVLYKRCKERALYILENSFKTVKQINDKLKQGLYPQEVIDKVMKFLTEYNFVNDYQYASMYIEYKSASKSRRQILQELMIKGIAKDVIEDALCDSGYSDLVSLKNIIDKKISRYDVNDRRQLQKFYQYLVGKGYSYSDVKKMLGEYTEVE